MGLRINTNRTAIMALRTLKINDQNQIRTLERLSTGLRINRASDDPSGLMISEILRSQIGSLRQAVENSTNAANLVATGEAAMSEINSLLVGIRESIIFALNTGGTSTEQVAAEQDSVDNAIAAIKRIADSTKFGTTRLLNGASGFAVTAREGSGLLDVQQLSVQYDFGNLNNETDFDVNVTRYAKNAEHEVSNLNPTTRVIETVGSNTSLRISGVTGTATVILNAGGTYQSFLELVNASAALTGVFADWDGRLYAASAMTLTLSATTITISNLGAGGTLVLGDSSSAVLTASETYVSNGAGLNGRAQITVVDPATDIIVTGADVILRVAGPDGVEEIPMSVGATYGDLADSINLLRGNLGIFASNNGRLYTERFGSNATISVDVIGGTGTYSGAGGMTRLTSPAVSFGTDAEATVAGAKAFADGNNLNVVSTFFTGSVRLNNPAYERDRAPALNLLTQAPTPLIGSTGVVNIQITRSGVNDVIAIAASADYLTFMNAVNAGTTNTGVRVSADGFMYSPSFGTGQDFTVEVTTAGGSISFVAAGGDGRLNDIDAALTALGSQGTRASLRIHKPLGETYTFTIANTSGLLFQFGSEANPNEQRVIGMPNLTPAFLGTERTFLGGMSTRLQGGSLTSLLSGSENDLFTVTQTQGNALYIVDAAINLVSDARSFLGAFVHDTVEPNIRSLEVAIENLSASESDIRDLDFAAEVANMTKTQILFQSGISVLAQANLVPQNVLTLLRG